MSTGHMPSYATPPGGLPPQTRLLSRRAVFNEAYVVIPKIVMTDIVTSKFPGWEGARGWVLARPLSGFAETLCQTVMEIAPGGGAERGEANPEAESVIFVTSGVLTLILDGVEHRMEEGGYAYLPPDCGWGVRNRREEVTTFQWIRKRYERVPGIDPPQAFVTN